MIPAAAVMLLAVAIWAQFDSNRANKRLRNLRRNAFVTNEKGHRVRYSEASAAVQAKNEA